MDMLTIEQARQRLGISDATIRRWLRAGRIKAELIRGKYYFSEQEITRLLSEQNKEDDLSVTKQQLIDLKSIVAELEREYMQLRERLERCEKLLERPVLSDKPFITKQQQESVSDRSEANMTLPDELPEGSVHFQDFLAMHNLKQHRRKIAGYLDAPKNGLRYESLPGRTPRESERYLTPEQASRLLQWLMDKHSDLWA